ncbi:NAD(P)-dependent oxidoreductase [Hazenella sp. IB182357]|uniref:NAD(P)-dependent oxidoreductase n=1 Tax=Polycladospora coralii TaxID=2771432 RepID=A0A926NCK9_9BACL|nr:NAD(P)-dependent oxidoreductase [Polycladospora coralii]MBD1370953.1 NAD(P)-dependent oxidoreductase [Polycladospora coralii]MBS7529892.1 NAD(P)-dependent oxidoreductase [Polycladospora coralii]
MSKILITGAAGKIGRNLSRSLKANTEHVFRLADLNTTELNHLKDVTSDLVDLNVADLSACKKACEGVDIVIHLAGDPSPDADFYHSLLENNIKGTYNIFRAAKDNQVSKVIVASSAQVVEGHPLDYQSNSHSPIRPKNMYGVSKSFAEAVASYFAYSEGMQAIAIRIAAYDDFKSSKEPMSARDMSAYISPEDFNHLIIQTLNAKHLPPFCILNGVSNNRFKRLSLEETKELVGYNPQSDAFELCQIELFD